MDQDDPIIKHPRCDSLILYKQKPLKDKRCCLKDVCDVNNPRYQTKYSRTIDSISKFKFLLQIIVHLLETSVGELKKTATYM